MKTIKRQCDNCGTGEARVTEQVVLGFVPLYLFEDSHQPYWVKAAVCTDCASIHQLPVAEKDVERAESRYLRVLVDNDHLTEEEAKDMLGI